MDEAEAKRGKTHVSLFDFWLDVKGREFLANRLA